MITHGSHCALNHHELDGFGVDVTIGDYVSIGGRTKLSDPPQHPKEWVATWNFSGHFTYRGGITIGNDVWIGQNVLLIGGACIGDGCVIGQNSVVAGTIAPYSIAVGNPCRPVKQRFTDEQVEALLEIKWWDWPHEKVQENKESICSDDIDGFIERFRETPHTYHFL